MTQTPKQRTKLNQNFTVMLRNVADLVQFERNARTHSEAQVAQLAASIAEFGFTNPVLIDETNTIIAGEGRVLAAKKLKMDAIPCIVLEGLTAAQKAAYVIADNKLALNSGWNTQMLLSELGRLAELNMDFTLSGFSEVEIIQLSAEMEESLSGLSTTGSESGQEPDWSGMPQFQQPSDKPFRSIQIHFNDEAAVASFAKKLGVRLTEKTKFLWYPERPKDARPAEVYE